MARKHSYTRFYLILLCGLSIGKACPAQLKEDPSRITAYFSFVHPVVIVNKDGADFNFQDGYTVGFPFGINFIESDKIAYSFEFVPGITAADGWEQDEWITNSPGDYLSSYFWV